MYARLTASGELNLLGVPQLVQNDPLETIPQQASLIVTMPPQEPQNFPPSRICGTLQ